MINSYSYGKICREGARVTIVGKPNVGKSSIFNYLLNNNRSIVTEIPGTTRDFIEESFILDGMLFVLVDTAGIRDVVDIIESEGILRTNKKISESSIVLFTVNACEGIEETDRKIFNKLKSNSNIRNKIIIVYNKMDLCKKISSVDKEFEEFKQVVISAKTGQGVLELRKILLLTATIDFSASLDSGITITNERHKRALVNSVKYLLLAKDDLSAGKSTEFVAGSLRISADYLEEIIGKVTSEDILNNIFSKFCIGK